MKRLLLVEDDKSLGATLYERLKKEGYDVIWVHTKIKAELVLKQIFFDLALLDIGLPDGSGFELAKNLCLKTKTSFLFLTAQSSAEERLLGFEIGAKDYIPKPFHLKELLLRLTYVLKNPLNSKEIQVGGSQINLENRLIINEKGRYLLNFRDTEILKYLIQSSPQILSRNEILDYVWGVNHYPNPRTIDNRIVRLRKILNNSKEQFIRSVHGVGYQWVHEGFYGE